MSKTATTETSFESIEIENLVPSKTNTRKDFNKEDIEKLSISIKDEGLLQPLVVRVHPEQLDKFEIIAGERRFRAAKKAKLKLLDCHIVEADDERALRIQADENLKRKDLNPIEEAATFQQLLELGGETQTKLAKRHKFSQSYLANRLRLLKLPKEWQKKLIDEEIPATFARDLTSWTKYPQVFEALPDEIQNAQDRYSDDYELELTDFREALEEALYSTTVSMHEAKFSVTDEVKERLQVENFENSRGSTIERAFNTDLFRKLQKEAEADQKKNMESNGSGKKSGKGTGTLFDVDEGGAVVTKEVKDTRSPKEIEADIKFAEREGAKKRKEQLNRKYADWKCAWYQEAIGVQLDHRKPSDGFLFKLLLFYSVTMDHGVNDFRGGHLKQAVKTWGGKIRGECYRFRANAWSGISSVQSSGKDLAATSLASYIRIPIEHNAFDHDQIGEIAKELAIDFEKEWKLTEDFLQLHTKPQLLDLVSEWKLPSEGLELKKRDEVIESILTMDKQQHLEFKKSKSGKVKPVGAPKALVRVKMPK